jgi:signal transduction histidine kinase
VSTSIVMQPDRVNILLVDDQPSKLLTYEAILGELGETLITARSATEALECLLRHDIAVVLVDVCMPHFDGYELAAMIRQHPRFQQTSIIFVSAILMTDLDRLRGYECGAVDYVPVPVVPEILRAKVSVFADLYRKTRALERLNTELEGRVAERTAALEATTAALQEADRRKDEFLAMLAHELRNPLAPIRTAVQLLRLTRAGDGQWTRARDIIERQVEHLVCLIDDLMDVSRITRGMITLQREPVTLGAVIARAIETTRPTIDARGHELHVEQPDESIVVHGDQTRLVQVVANILHNAAKFTPAGGRIVLSVHRDDGHAVISITDTGRGIPREVLPDVFDLFTKAHAAADAGHGGLGIGLALVRRLVEMHGGTVVAHSEGRGHGSRFTVQLPLLQAAPAIAAAALSESTPDESPLAARTVRRRILVADDNLDAAEALSTLLQALGHEVRVAHDGAEALEVGGAFEPEIVLLDLGMPVMDGLEAARRMRQLPWGALARVVAVTGWGQQQDRARTAEAGFDAHLVKPVTDLDLLPVLTEGRREPGEAARAI